MTHDDTQINDAPEAELDSFDLTEDLVEDGEEEILPKEDLLDDAEPGIAEEPDFFAEEK